MSKILSREKSQKVSRDPWEALITETEEKLNNARAMVRDLTIALKTFRERRDAGDPYPSTQN